MRPDLALGVGPVTSTYDLAIVGYGPTGMMLASLMGRQGHSVVVLDKHRGLYNLPRAACFDDEIMRTFQKLHLVDAMMPGAVVQTDYDWVNGDGEKLLEMTYDNPARGGWAALYMMYQPHIETVLDGLCRSLPSVDVRQGVAVDTLRVDDDEVELTATTRDDGRTRVRARFVVGADGGPSFVRRALGIDFSDYRFQENWLVCDFRKRHELDAVPTFRQVCDPAQPVSIVRLGPNHHRFSFMLAPDEAGPRATDEARVWERVSRYITPEDAELVRVANYVFRSRVADCWRQGPVLLAGDAAHEMPPFLAQGMCSGMRDSHNLAWKLDLVLTGRAHTVILDSYQAEREPHVRFITEKAIELGRVQTLRDPQAARARDTRLLALRQANQAPEKILYPGLTAGLVSTGTPHAGAVFPQGQVCRADGKAALFDDVVGAGPTILASSPDQLTALTPDQTGRWRALGGHIATLRSPFQPGSNHNGHQLAVELLDTGGIYAAWFESYQCAAAVVRPDWYLYGTATDGPGLAALMDEMLGTLQPAGTPAAA